MFWVCWPGGRVGGARGPSSGCVDIACVLARFAVRSRRPATCSIQHASPLPLACLQRRTPLLSPQAERTEVEAKAAQLEQQLAAAKASVATAANEKAELEVGLAGVWVFQ